MEKFGTAASLSKIKLSLTVLFSMLAVLYIFSVGGCDNNSELAQKETDEPHFIRAQEELRRGNDAEAMSAFLKIVDKRKDAPESHLELGRLYLNKLSDPIAAIYHFRKYLEYKPNSQASDMVRQMIETAQKKFAASLPESPFESNIKRMEMEELVQKLQKENFELKQKLSQSSSMIESFENMQKISAAAQRNLKAEQPSLPAHQVKPAAPSQQQAPSVEVRPDTPSTYTVQAGDTLSSISRKVYGSSSRWKEIFQANKDKLSSPESLKLGQTLRIPR